jgi:hypothetical protein
LIDFVSSGMTFAQSMPMVLPKPRQSGHAPVGDWYEKSPALAGSKARAHFGHTRPCATRTLDVGATSAALFM